MVRPIYFNCEVLPWNPDVNIYLTSSLGIGKNRMIAQDFFVWKYTSVMFKNGALWARHLATLGANTILARPKTTITRHTFAMCNNWFLLVAFFTNIVLALVAVEPQTIARSAHATSVNEFILLTLFAFRNFWMQFVPTMTAQPSVPFYPFFTTIAAYDFMRFVVTSRITYVTDAVCDYGPFAPTLFAFSRRTRLVSSHPSPITCITQAPAEVLDDLATLFAWARYHFWHWRSNSLKAETPAGWRYCCLGSTQLTFGGHAKRNRLLRLAA